MDPYQTLSDYDELKTFKINDAYEVTIYDTEPSTDKLLQFFSEDDIKLYGINDSKENRVFQFKNCIKFTTPVYSPKVELIEFCNTTREIYIPNPDPPKELQLEFSETERRYIWKFIKYCLTKNFLDETMNYDRDLYNPYRYIDRIDIAIYDNNLRHKTMTHRFMGCRISTYDYGMDLDYAGSELIKPKIGFNFLKYSIIYGDDTKVEIEDTLSTIEKAEEVAKIKELMGLDPDKPMPAEKLDLKLKGGEPAFTKKLIAD